MNLPTVVTPRHEVALHTGKKIKIRPFLAQEEKILLMAIEDKEASEEKIQDALMQILANCIVEPKGFDLNTLSAIDMDILFLELRKQSVGEIVELTYETPFLFEGCEVKECPETITTKISLKDVEIVQSEGKKNIIMLDDNVGVKLRYPTLGTSRSIDTLKSKKTDVLFGAIANSIEEVFSDENSWSGDSFERTELIKWVEQSVGHKQLEEIIEFISDVPYISKKFTVKCAMCGLEKEMEAKGLSDFFI